MPMSLTSINTDLKTAIIHNPLTIAPTVPLTEVIDLIIESGYILVLDDHQLIGIVTNHNLVRHYTTTQNLAELSIADVMISPVVTLRYQEYTNVLVPFNLLHSHQLEHLPLVDDEGTLVGLIKRTKLLRLVNPKEAHCLLETLEQKVARLEAEKLELIQTYQAEMAQVAAEREQAMIALEQLNHELEIEVAGRTVALQASQEFIQKIADASPNILYLFDLQEQRNVYANRELTDLLGYTPKQLQDLGNKFVQELIHPDDQSQFQRLPAYFEQLTTHQDDKVLECEYRMRHINGDWRWLSSREAVFSRDAQGQVKQLIGTAQDISERKRLEQEQARLISILEASTADLIRATQLKDEFLATISHELRTPLNAILGMSESLEEGVYGSINERQSQSIATIHRSGNNLLGMINDILEVSNITAGQCELKITNVEINELCQSSWSIAEQRALPKRIPVTISVAADMGEMAIDHHRIQQVLINLLGNAIKFTPDHGQITLDVYLEQPSNDPQQFICFAITDTGIGIAAADLSKLFQPFIQVDSNLNRQYEGTGLGLALVKQIVELHGGKVSVQSKVGKGSCFAFKLPLLMPSNDPKPLGTVDNFR